MQQNLHNFQKNTLDKTSTVLNKNDIIINTNSNQKKNITIYTDGACKNNGKKNAIAGIGVYSENVYNISEKIEGKQTNQRMNYMLY